MVGIQGPNIESLRHLLKFGKFCLTAIASNCNINAALNTLSEETLKAIPSTKSDLGLRLRSFLNPCSFRTLLDVFQFR